MVELLTFKVTGAGAIAGLWIALALLALAFEVVLQVLLFPLSVHPIRRFQERHRRAMDRLHGRDRVPPEQSPVC